MGRGRPGSGVRPHGDGIQLNFRWRGKRWRPTLRIKATPANLKYAERQLAEINDRIRNGTFRFADYFPDAKNAPPEGTKQPLTFGEYAALWMKSRGDIEAATARGYQCSLDAHLLPVLRDKPIGAILHSEVAALFGGSWKSAKTRNNALIPCRGIFLMALRDGAIDRDPTAGIKNQKHQAQEANPVTQEESQLIVAKIRELNGDEANYFEFAFWTGMRTSELVELRWSDYDRRARTVRVSRARVSGNLKDTKTHVARTVELNSVAYACLERQRAVTQLLPDGYVFVNGTTRKPYADDQIPRRRWTRALRALGIAHRDAYQTRHSYATWCLMAGLNPAWLAKQLGHSTEVLLRTYAKWVERADRGRELAKLEATLIGPKAKEAAK